VKTDETGSWNLLDDAYAILKKNITYTDNQVKDITLKQWKRMVEWRVNDTVNKEVMEKSSEDQAS